MPDASAQQARAALQRALAGAALDDLPAALRQALLETLAWLAQLDAELARPGPNDRATGGDGIGDGR
jgi:hypothetical protein